MRFPPEFQLNQGNLQNFMDCRRRFYLGSIRRLAWPAISSEPMLENEHLSQQGAAFHRLVQQYFLGIPPEMLKVQAGNAPLSDWLDQFLATCMQLPGISDPGARWLPELNLTSQEAGFRVTAKYDLLVMLPDGQLIIYDWKTSRARTRRNYLAERAQTQLYRYLLAKIGHRFIGQPVHPEQISMIYWFANHPGQPEIFPYTTHQFEKDAESIRQSILTIQDLVARDSLEKPGEGFPLTPNEKRCAFCVYRSLCGRGVEAGISSQMVEETDLFMDGELDLSEVDFTLEQIAEIEF